MKTKMTDKSNEVTLDVPSGERAEDYFEKFFGSAPTPHEEMPDDADVDATYVVKLK